ncbi:glycosyltransferase family 9 protein [Sphingobacterium sp. SGG-5]|uniref:glycosyltransferase family 9 protein n=1 Tax=Sphingobacterium sp. SGG-5 TaxID=2710881 RepID=UPI0013EA17FE|nr:glycosyltransferase family 9 protein [Sphingobacterium sp. SGG-5]NGM61699.1 glycosyltransferase family 9 protein [Sphingobacterium sp. SGG-5]
MATPIVPYLGTVDSHIIFDTPWMKLEHTDQPAKILHLVEKLRTYQFDGCIIFSVYSQNILATALLTYLAEIPLRTAYSRENPYQLLTHWFPDPEPLSQINHQIKRDLMLLQMLDIDPDLRRLPQLRLYRDIYPDATPSLEDWALPASYIIVNMEVSEPKRQFPSQHANELLRSLLNKGEWIIFTGQYESDYLQDCIQGISDPRFINLIGKTTLDDVLCLIERAKAVISVNTGIVHMACAYSRPTVVLYANTNPQHIPWSPRSTQIVFDIPEMHKSKNQIIKYVDKLSPEETHTIPSATEILNCLVSL